MNRNEFIADITRLVAALIPEIQDDYRTSPDDPTDSEPGMLVTVGADNDGWSYQTGDNSYAGGAYGYATWGLGYVYRDSVPADVAEEIASDLEESEPYFDDDFVSMFNDVTDEQAAQS
jgi:hypothetical protein